jgi:hypothetical protein
MTPWTIVWLSGNVYHEPDGSVQGAIHGDRRCLEVMLYVAEEPDIHLSLRGPDGELTLIMDVRDAKELAAKLLRATDPARRSNEKGTKTLTPWAIVWLSGNAYHEPDGNVEGAIHGDHVCLDVIHYRPDEQEIHLSLRSPKGQLTVIMDFDDAKELAAELLRATDPTRRSNI